MDATRQPAPSESRSFLEQVTPLLITFDEMANIERALAALSWARCIVVVDSGSTDGTLQRLRADPRINLLIRPFDDFARQCQAGLDRVETDWVLSMDADYEPTLELLREIAALSPPQDLDGYAIAFDYCVHGHALRGSLYPPRVALHRTHGARYRMEGHGHRVDLPGRVEPLAGRIRHDDRKALSRWLSAQARYAEAEARHLAAARWRDVGWADRVRKLVVVAPWLVPLHCLVVKRGLLDGLPGWHYALQRGIAEAVLSLRLVEGKLADAEASKRRRR
jgi:glycosyltransferase involved in cell wall biosynthesis